jgi:hypothetical protein
MLSLELLIHRIRIMVCQQDESQRDEGRRITQKEEAFCVSELSHD